VIGIAFFAALAIAAFLIIRAIARAARRRKTSAEGADPAVKAPDLGNEE
jgi:hypothetical protein